MGRQLFQRPQLNQYIHVGAGNTVDVRIYKGEKDTAMDTYKCYYCVLTFSIFQDIIKHLVETHPLNCLKYREYELNSVTGVSGYRTKEFKNIVPADGEVFVTSDYKVGIYKGVENQKKTKLNTPIKNDLIETKTESYPPFIDIDKNLDEYLQEMEMEQLHDGEHKDEFSELIECIPEVLENLKESGQLSSFKKFCELIVQKRFPLTNICYLLFLDIVDWYSNNSTTEMRYLRNQTRQFWEVGYRLFKGKFIRFMSGPRNTGLIVKGVEERGNHSAERSQINFAVPSLSMLTKEKLNPVFPGVIETSIEFLSKCLTSNFVKIAVDGKKIARGKGKIAGDIDCWGFEAKPTLQEKVDRYNLEKNRIQELTNMIESMIEKSHHFIPDFNIPKVISDLQHLILVLSKRIKDLRGIIIRLQLGLDKFMKLGDLSSKHWSKSRFAPVISIFKVNLYKYEAEQAIETSLRLVKQFGYFCSKLNGCEHNYSLNDYVNIERHSNYHQLKSDIPGENPQTTKQKSETWLNLRTRSSVTGSTCHTALGQGKLKDMQAHFDRVKTGIDNRQFTEVQLRNMNYGTDHEIDGIATVVARILPSMFPGMEYFEEGCIPIPHETNPFFMIVSPDGSLRDSKDASPKIMYENKCKVENNYSTPVFYQIPKYYIAQLLSEMACYGCNELLFTCWSKSSTTAFSVRFDQKLWKIIWDELIYTYYGAHCKRPKKFPDSKRQIDKLFDDFQTHNVTFIGEFPSCFVSFPPKDVKYDGTSVYVSNENHEQQYRELPCDDILKTLHEMSRTLDDIYKLCRSSASEILVYMASDLNRSYHAEINNAHPIAYAMKGTSMTNETFGKMLEHVTKKCEENGLNVIATASDGQWHKYGVRDLVDNKPLTLYQLQRDIWKEQMSVSASEMRKYLRNLMKVSTGNLDNVTVIKNSKGKLTISHTTDKPVKIFKYNLKWHFDEHTSANEKSFHDVSENLESDIIQTVETFAPSLDIDENVVSGINTIAENRLTSEIDTASGYYLKSLFEEECNDIFQTSLTNYKETNYGLKHHDILNKPNSDINLREIENNEQISYDNYSTSDVMGAAYSLLYGEVQPDSMEHDKITYNNHDENQTELIPHSEIQVTECEETNEHNIDVETNAFLRKCEIVLCKLQSVVNARKTDWQQFSVKTFADMVVQKEICCSKIQKNELIIVLKELSSLMNTDIKIFKSWTKSKLYDSLLSALKTANNMQTNSSTIKQHHSNPDKLTKILSKWLNKVPKETLACVLAHDCYHDRYLNWCSKSAMPNTDIIQDSKNRSWFSVPSNSCSDAVRFHFDDCCHILTCLRTKICTTGIAGLQQIAWEKAAISESTKLNIAIVKECIDKQSVPFARRMFDYDVEDFMKQNHYKKEAEFVRLIRDWFEAEDSPGIPATERCCRRLTLRDYLLEDVNFAAFPPATQYMKGIPIVTYEALLVHLERKLQIFQYVPDHKYNVRALGTQEVEQFFSTMSDMDPSGLGTPKPDDIPDIIATAAYLDNVRMSPERSFHFKTSRAPVYPDVVLEHHSNDSNEKEHVNDVMDHFFDTEARLRRKQKRKSGLITSPSQPARRQLGVRQYHACREDKLSALSRKNKTDL